MRDLVALRRPKHVFENSEVYYIPCGGCKKAYIGETSVGFKKRLQQHKDDCEFDRDSNALVQHRTHTSHQPNWGGADSIKKGLRRQQRRIFESAMIATRILESTPTSSTNTGVTNSRGSSHKLASFTALMITKGFNHQPRPPANRRALANNAPT